MPVFDFFHWTKESGNTLADSGPLIQVEIGMPAALEEFCTTKGIPIPVRQVGWALIDTGASNTAIHQEVLEQLSIAPIDAILSRTPSGQGRSFVYPTRVWFPSIGVQNLPLARVIGCDLKWMTPDQKEIIMLLGRDLLQHFLMIYNGRMSTVTLAY